MSSEVELDEKVDTAPIKVLIVDDDPLALSTMSNYFRKDPSFEVVAKATNGVEALERLKEHRVDVVLSDINMPRMNGLELLDEILKNPKPPVFIGITSIDQDDNMIQAMAKGGNGYLLKSQTPASIRQAVRDALGGGKVVSPNAVDALIKEIPYLNPDRGLARNLLEEVTAHDYPLKDAEKAVLKLLCLGKSNAEISDELQYSESSIKKRVSNLIHYFGAKSRLDLVVILLNKPE